MEVSKSGFYGYLGRRRSNARIEREALEGFVVEAFERRRGRYGYRRIDRELRKSGIAVSEKRALRTMRKLGLAGKGAARKHRIRKRVEPGDPRSNLVERAFTVGGRNRLWVGASPACPQEKGGSISQPRQAPSPARSRAGRCPGASPGRSRSTR
ncbi:IS3 family transposase [Ellagibacter isourolithinifaciens]|uniref:IS3 family transposase n=1 Tax=Ellagibacter isourolithinifaciens TaxID=2137581 RepID=UPI003A9431C8